MYSEFRSHVIQSPEFSVITKLHLMMSSTALKLNSRTFPQSGFSGGWLLAKQLIGNRQHHAHTLQYH